MKVSVLLAVVLLAVVCLNDRGVEAQKGRQHLRVRLATKKTFLKSVIPFYRQVCKTFRPACRKYKTVICKKKPQAPPGQTQGQIGERFLLHVHGRKMEVRVNMVDLIRQVVALALVNL